MFIVSENLYVYIS